MDATRKLIERFLATLDSRDWNGFAAVLHPPVTDFWPESYDPPPGREHLVERW